MRLAINGAELCVDTPGTHGDPAVLLVTGARALDGLLGEAVLRPAGRRRPVRDPLRPARHRRLDDLSARPAGLHERRSGLGCRRDPGRSGRRARARRRDLDGRRADPADHGRAPGSRARHHPHVDEPGGPGRPRSAAAVRRAPRAVRARRRGGAGLVGPRRGDRVPARGRTALRGPRGIEEERCASCSAGCTTARPAWRAGATTTSWRARRCRGRGSARSPCRRSIIHGTDDPLFPPAHGEALAREIPGARLLLIEGLGHELPRWAWDEVLPALVDVTG